MIQGDIHFFAEKDCPYEYNITSLSLRCLSPYATEIRHLFENVKIVSEYMEDQNEPCDHLQAYSILPNPVGKRKPLDENHQVVNNSGPDGIRTRDLGLDRAACLAATPRDQFFQTSGQEFTMRVGKCQYTQAYFNTSAGTLDPDLHFC